MKREKWKRLVAMADRMLLTPYENLSKKEKKQWITGTRKLLEELRKPEK